MYKIVENEEIKGIDCGLLDILGVDRGEEGDEVIEGQFYYWYFGVFWVYFWEDEFLKDLQVFDAVQLYHCIHFNDKIYALLT